jgi:hypothetical protein
MIDDMLSDPVILDDDMTGQNYPDFLPNGLPEQLQDVPLAPRIAPYFQHNGVPFHYIRLVMQHLIDTFLNRWIDCDSTFKWPPISPDPKPVKFLFMGMDEE